MSYDMTRLIAGDNSCFSDIVEGGYLYVDKTDLVHRLTHDGYKYHYLSRPKRFGKSLLVDTLECYFTARKPLFEKLKLGGLEQEWTQRPVIRLDMSLCAESLEDCIEEFDIFLGKHERLLHIANAEGKKPANRLQQVICQYNEQGYPRVAVLIDEYDSPLVDHYVRRVKGAPHEQFDDFVQLYRSLFLGLKGLGNHLQFLFITGCARVQHLNLFSGFNNLRNISLDDEYATLCGFTEHELCETYGPEIAYMAELREESYEQALAALRQRFDGYRFSGNPELPKVYNPFSVVNALYDATHNPSMARNITYHWMAPGSVALLGEWGVDIGKMLSTGDGFELTMEEMNLGDVTAGNNQELLLYQAGMLTIDTLSNETFKLRIPNEEVRSVMLKVVLPRLLEMPREEFDLEWKRWEKAFNAGRLEEALWSMRILLGRGPNGPKFYKGAAPEHKAALLFNYICYASRMVVNEEPNQTYGTPDSVVETRERIYVIEFKRPSLGGVAGAWEQMQDKRYVEPHLGAATKWGLHKPVTALAVGLREDGQALCDWKARVYTTTEERLELSGEYEAAERWHTLEKDAGNEDCSSTDRE